jgi:effector-binding domain-containing protein
MIYTKELFSFILARDDFGSEEEKIIIQPKGKKISCIYHTGLCSENISP